MFWRKKQYHQQIIPCNHDWFELDTCQEIVDTSIGLHIDCEHQELMYIYCPKCDVTKRVSAAEGKRILKANEIKKNYKTQ